jgi:CDP-diacylglycerol--serine O-phosphatidyltransferase
MLPTMVTMTSLLSASTALVLLVMAPPTAWRDASVAACLGWSMMADGIDGPLARRLNATSSLGAHLDSLCDLTAFGLVPPLWLIARHGLEYGAVVVVAGVCWIAAAAFRLARFADDGVTTKATGQYFRGVPTPVAGAAIVTAVTVSTWTSLPAVELVVLVAGAVLMPSTVPYPKAGIGRWPWVAAVPVGVVALSWWAHVGG